MTEDTVGQLKRILQKSYEVDCPKQLSSSQLDADFTSWCRYKEMLVESVQKETYEARRANTLMYMTR